MADAGRFKPSGVLITTHPDSDKTEMLDTVQCRHCGRHWAWRKGSGNVRGWCLRCNGFTCGSDACDFCVPQEQLLENIEQGRPLDHRPIIATSGWESR